MMMVARTLLHTVIALILIGVQIMENVIVLLHGAIYVMDRLIDLIEDLLDLL